MQSFKLALISTSVIALTACGGGSSNTAPQSSTTSIPQPPPPIFNVSLVNSSEFYKVMDGESVTVALNIENTTGEPVEIVHNENLTGEEPSPYTVSLDGESVVVKFAELDYPLSYTEYNVEVALKAGDLTYNVVFDNGVENDELLTYENQKKQFDFSRNEFQSPFVELFEIELRYLLQAEILSYVGVGEYSKYYSTAQDMQRNYINQGLEQTQSAYDAYTNQMPQSDEEAAVFIAGIEDALDTYSDLYAGYYQNSRLPNLMTFDLGLPRIVSPQAKINPDTYTMSMIYGETFYGEIIEENDNTRFVFKEDYKFLDALANNYVCAGAPL